MMLMLFSACIFLSSIFALRIEIFQELLHPFCHQNSLRCFHFRGDAFGLCSRCMGIYLSIPFWGFCILKADHSKKIKYLMPYFLTIGIVVTMVCVIFKITHTSDGNNLIRFICGIFHGLVTLTFIDKYYKYLIIILRTLLLRQNGKNNKSLDIVR